MKSNTSLPPGDSKLRKSITSSKKNEVQTKTQSHEEFQTRCTSALFDASGPNENKFIPTGIHIAHKDLLVAGEP